MSLPNGSIEGAHTVSSVKIRFNASIIIKRVDACGLCKV